MSFELVRGQTGTETNSNGGVSQTGALQRIATPFENVVCFVRGRRTELEMLNRSETDETEGSKWIQNVYAIEEKLRTAMIKKELAVMGTFGGPLIAGGGAVIALSDPHNAVVLAPLVIMTAVGIGLFECSTQKVTNLSAEIASLAGELRKEYAGVLEVFDIANRL